MTVKLPYTYGIAKPFKLTYRDYYDLVHNLSFSKYKIYDMIKFCGILELNEYSYDLIAEYNDGTVKIFHSLKDFYGFRYESKNPNL